MRRGDGTGTPGSVRAARLPLGILLIVAALLSPLVCAPVAEAVVGGRPAGAARPASAVYADQVVACLEPGADDGPVLQGAAALGLRLVTRSASTGALLFDAGPAADELAVARVLTMLPGVAAAEANHAVHAAAVTDPRASEQWALPVIGAEAAWTRTTGSVTIAVIDTGVDGTHADLAGRVDAGWDFVNDDASAVDDEGHGTHVAGIAAAGANDGVGIAGVAPTARVLPVKVLDSWGEGGWFQVADGLRYAADRGAAVANLSLSGDYPSTYVSKAVAYARERNVVVVAAAGNSASAVAYPAAFPGVVAVGASDRSGHLAPYSNSGAALDLVAPGDDILSTMGGGHAYESGTSMASPFVAGAAALVASLPGRPSASLVESALAHGATDAGAAGRDSSFGWGVLDVPGALDAAGTLSGGGTASIGGVVSDAALAPLAGIDVRALRDEDGVWAFAARTTSAGWGYSLGGLAPGRYRVVFADPAGRYVSATYGTIDIGAGSSNTLNGSMNGAGAFTGRVVDPLGNGIAGARVEVYKDTLVADFGWMYWWWCSAATAVAGPDGSFDAGGLPGGTYIVRASDPSGAHLARYSDGAPAPTTAYELPAGVRASLEITLPAVGTISGTVTGGSAPLAGIRAVAMGPYGASGSAYTDANGAYVIGGLEAGSYRVLFEDPSGNRLSRFYPGVISYPSAVPVAVPLGGAATGIGAALPAAGVITGRLTDGFGVGLPGAEVAWGGHRSDAFGAHVDLAGSVRTDALGYFRIGGLRSGVFGLRFTDVDGDHATEYFGDSGEESGALPVGVAQGAVTDVGTTALESAGHVRGTVRNQAGEAVRNCEVTAWGPGATGADHSGLPVRTTLTAEDGSYDLGGLPPGAYVLAFSPDDEFGEWAPDEYASPLYFPHAYDAAAAETVTVAAGADTSGLDATLEQWASVSGRVTGDAGEPLSGIAVQRGSRAATLPAGFTFRAEETAITGADGRYAFPCVVPGSEQVLRFDPSAHNADSGSALLPEYHSDALGVNDARELVLLAGEPVSGDATLSATPPADVFGPLVYSDAAPGWRRAPVLLRLGAVEQQSPPVTMWYSLDGVSFEPTPGEVTLTGDGEHLVRYYGVDAADNPSAVETAVVRVDATPGTTTLNPDTSRFTTLAPLTLHAADAHTGVASVCYRIDGATTQTVPGDSAEVTITVGGPHTITYWCTDGVGNVEPPKVRDFRISPPDALPPVTTALGVPAGWTASNATVTLSAADPVSGVEWTRVSVNGSAATTYPAGTRMVFPVTAEGTTTFEFRSGDWAGNVEAPKWAQVRIDRTAPRTTLVTGPHVDWLTSPPHIALSVADTGSATAYWRAGSGSVNTYYGPFQLAIEGTTTFSYWAVDAAGNRETTRTETFRIDTSRPTFHGAVRGAYEASANISVTATDVVSRLASAEMRLDLGTWVPIGPISTNVPGLHRIEYRAADVAGNLAEQASDFLVIAAGGDTASPETTATGVPSGWATSDVVLGLDAQDEGPAGVEHTWVSLGSAPASEYAPPLTVRTEGTTTVRFWSVDWLGNVEPTRAVTVRLDKTPPTTTPSGVSFEWTNGDQVVSLAAADAHSGARTTWIQVGGGEVTTYTAPVTLSATGTTLFYYWSQDAAGNMEPVQTGMARIDRTAPVSTLGAVPEGWSRAPVRITMSATDVGSGLATRFYRLNGGPATPYVSPVTISAEGTTTLAYWAVDQAGNAETARTVTLRIDSTPPSTTVDVRPEYDEPATIALESHDAVSGVARCLVSLDGALWAPAWSVSTSVLGTHTLSYMALDVAGNQEPTRTVTFRVLPPDAEAPRTEVTGVPAGWASRTVTVALSALDSGGSGLTETRYALGDGGTLPYTAPFAVSAEGTTVVRFWSRDRRGNVEATRSVTVLVDRTPPQTSSDATAAYDGTATIVLGCSDTLSGPARTLWRIDEGEWADGPTAVTSAAGTHTAEWYGVDAAGNREATRSATFLVVRGTALTLRASSAIVGFGASAGLTGRLTGLEGYSSAVQVELQAYAGGWRTVARTVAGADGAFSFVARPRALTLYRARFVGVPGGSPSVSRAVRVTPRVALSAPKAPSPPLSAGPVTFTGTIAPAHWGPSVRLLAYLWDGRTWRYATSAWAGLRSSGSGSVYRATLRLGAPGTWRVRAVHGTDAAHAYTTSPFTTVTVGP